MAVTAKAKKNHKPQGDSRQKDLPGMPAKTKASLRGEEYAETLEVISDKKENARRSMETLISQMKADKATVVKCKSAAGTFYEFTLEEKTKLKVKKS